MPNVRLVGEIGAGQPQPHTVGQAIIDARRQVSARIEQLLRFESGRRRQQVFAAIGIRYPRVEWSAVIVRDDVVVVFGGGPKPLRRGIIDERVV